MKKSSSQINTTIFLSMISSTQFTYASHDSTIALETIQVTEHTHEKDQTVSDLRQHY